MNISIRNWPSVNYEINIRVFGLMNKNWQPNKHHLFYATLLLTLTQVWMVVMVLMLLSPFTEIWTLFQKNTVLWLAVNCMSAHYFCNLFFTWNRVTFKLNSDKLSFFHLSMFYHKLQKGKIKTAVVSNILKM